jgi:hypothetical protein
MITIDTASERLFSFLTYFLLSSSLYPSYPPYLFLLAIVARFSFTYLSSSSCLSTPPLFLILVSLFTPPLFLILVSLLLLLPPFCLGISPKLAFLSFLLSPLYFLYLVMVS